MLEFYVVWNPKGRNPHVIHETENIARTEACRLATKQPGDEFYVLKVVACAFGRVETSINPTFLDEDLRDVNKVDWTAPPPLELLEGCWVKIIKTGHEFQVDSLCQCGCGGVTVKSGDVSVWVGEGDYELTKDPRCP